MLPLFLIHFIKYYSPTVFPIKKNQQVKFYENFQQYKNKLYISHKKIARVNTATIIAILYLKYTCYNQYMS
jgi:hypothetical protein